MAIFYNIPLKSNIINGYFINEWIVCEQMIGGFIEKFAQVIADVIQLTTGFTNDWNLHIFG